jgi:hypothetical protein
MSDCLRQIDSEDDSLSLLRFGNASWIDAITAAGLFTRSAFTRGCRDVCSACRKGKNQSCRELD